MNKRKLFTLALTLCMVAILAIGGSLAYFTDSDGATNVMTTGNVKIIQNEQQRGTDGALEAFKDNKKLVPYTGEVGENGVASAWGTSADINGTSYKMFDMSKNAVDKIVTVTNKGTEEAYIRTLFAFEVPNKEQENVYDFLVADRILNLTADTKINITDRTFTWGGVKYLVCETYYGNESKLAAGATSEPSLRQLYLNANTDNEWYDQVGEKYNLLVLSQATQTQGFGDAKTALNTAFGDPEKVSQDELEGWFAECVEISFG